MKNSRVFIFKLIRYNPQLIFRSKKLNISFDDEIQKTELSLKDAEKFIVSFKLQRYIKSLMDEKSKLLIEAR